MRAGVGGGGAGGGWGWGAKESEAEKTAGGGTAAASWSQVKERLQAEGRRLGGFLPSGAEGRLLACPEPGWKRK